VSMLRCWALRPRAQSRVAAAANKVRRIAHLEWNFDLKIIWAYWAERFVLNRKSVLLCFQQGSQRNGDFVRFICTE
jgi:hypothetical protein